MGLRERRNSILRIQLEPDEDVDLRMRDACSEAETIVIASAVCVPPPNFRPDSTTRGNLIISIGDSPKYEADVSGSMMRYQAIACGRSFGMFQPITILRHRIGWITWQAPWVRPLPEGTLVVELDLEMKFDVT